jgi:hypothetical protein
MKLNLTTKYEIEKVTDCKDKRFSFLPTHERQKRKADPHFAHLAASTHKPTLRQPKEQNLPRSERNIIWNDCKLITFAQNNET